jgi:hypothetical protein
MEKEELARRAAVWLCSAQPEITIDWDAPHYDDEVIGFLWADYLEPVAQVVERYAEQRVAEVAAKIKADYRLEEQDVTEASVSVGEGR